METVTQLHLQRWRDVSNGENKPLSDLPFHTAKVRWTGNRWRWKTGHSMFLVIYRAETRRQRDG